MTTETAGSPTPTEVLIPEARQHQKRRYRRRGAFVVIAACIVAALVLSSLLLLRGPAIGGRASADQRAAAAVAGTSGVLSFRPVLCFAPAYAPPPGSGANAAVRSTGAIPACAMGSLLSAANMDVTPGRGPAGYSSNVPAPDLQFASVPSTSVKRAGYASDTVLLPGLHGACDQVKTTRCVLGPSVMSSRAIASATVTQTPTHQWVVDYSTTDAGAALWDRVAEQNFHQLLAVEVNGVVYTAPILQPTQSAFSSFNGKGELSGNLTRSEAVRLANALTHRAN
jgi:hypothetical protein